MPTKLMQPSIPPEEEIPHQPPTIPEEDNISTDTVSSEENSHQDIDSDASSATNLDTIAAAAQPQKTFNHIPKPNEEVGITRPKLQREVKAVLQRIASDKPTLRETVPSTSEPFSPLPSNPNPSSTSKVDSPPSQTHPSPSLSDSPNSASHVPKFTQAALIRFDLFCGGQLLDDDLQARELKPKTMEGHGAMAMAQSKVEEQNERSRTSPAQLQWNIMQHSGTTTK
ncbi:uncharacterized protein LOC135226619 [Macrobrachium nipponense]|uniref:uncharacterized protein LOC135226619 n=1 Tax=Macrobrachium nipponense TaxID=159736 RepID=UPI0030C8BCED